MERDTTTDPSELQRPDGNDLQTNYDLHDVGEIEFVERCEELGLIVEPWGIDMRDDEGEGIVYDDAMDFKIYADVSLGVGVVERRLVGLVDVKTKSSPQWMGLFNLRHLRDYQEHAAEKDVPTFVIMFQVNGDTIVDEFVFMVGPYEDDEHVDKHVLTSRGSDAISVFPDGNHAAHVQHSGREDWTHFVAQMMFEKDSQGR